MNKFAPYQILFPIGILGSLLGVGIWLVQDLNLFVTPSILIHSKLMMGGFIWAFIVGFLMTAIPRMTGTASANLAEMVIAVSLVLTAITQSLFIDAKWFYSTSIVVILFIIFYGGRRVIQTKKEIPVFFSHAGMAMILALGGAYSYLQGNNFMGFHLYYLGAVLLLVLGIGTRFFSFLSGLPSVFENKNKREQFVFHILGCFTVLFLYLAGKGYGEANLVLALLTSFYMIFIWQVFRKSERSSALKFGLRLVASVIPSGFFMSWLLPQYFVAWFHLIFIGCFSVIIYAVATRVTLAHGSYSTDLEMKSKSLWYVMCFFIASLISRISYSFVEGLWQKSFLHLAATFWLLAVCFWSYSFLNKIFVRGEQKKPSC